MKKIVFPLLFIAGFGCAFGGLKMASYTLNDSFSEKHLAFDAQPSKRWSVHNTESHFFDQPYHYLGKGSQSFVFASEDGRYVIKFFRMNRFDKKRWPLAPVFQQKIQEEKILEKQKKLWDLFSSCHLAFTELKEECGLLYMHLNRGEKAGTLLVYDALKKPHLINLDEAAFCVQLRAEPTMKRFSPADLEQLTLLLKKRFDKGIDDHDPVLQKNTGFVGDQAIFIDIGSFYPNPSVRHHQYETAYQMTRKVIRWLDQKAPELGQSLDNSIKKNFKSTA